VQFGVIVRGSGEPLRGSGLGVGVSAAFRVLVRRREAFRHHFHRPHFYRSRYSLTPTFSNAFVTDSRMF
jgi:hypothetical protein